MEHFMKAVRIHAYGGPEVLVYEDAPRPEPAAGEVLVKVHATALNPVDRGTRAGYLQGMVHFALPFTPGLDLAGVVEAVGDGVTTVAVGDTVYGYSNMMRQGAYAEYAVLSQDEIAPAPASVDVVTAASVPLAGLTAWQGLFTVAGLQPGQTVLIHGAGGGVGGFAVQFARANGARVLATAGSDKIALLRDLGVAEAIDYTSTRFEDVARDVDVVFDTVAGDLTERSLAVLKPGGIYVTPAGQPDA
jgi:NADPH:quinone reductase-like Zn-dependent oxidoreductase